MRVPLQIAFHGIDHSDAVEESIRASAAKLEKLNDRIMACRVAVEGLNHGAERHRSSVRIRIDVTVPGAELVVTEGPDQGPTHDVRAVLRRAFGAMERRLKEHRDRAHA